MNADPTPIRGGADNIIGKCPLCGKPGLVQRANWPFTSEFVHITAKVDWRGIEILSHPIQRDPCGLIDASSI
jgi:hypothetical protein